jgi:hypothetical protein
MELNNYFRIIIYFCIILIIVSLCINVVTAWGLFSSTSTTTIHASGTPEQIFKTITGIDQGMYFVWGAILSIGGFTAVVVAYLLQSSSVLGIYLYSAVFWVVFNGTLANININNFIPPEFLTIAIVGVFFVWVASIIGMLTIS